MDKTELISQTKLAFDFIQKLYFEVSYLIKETEGLLSEEDEEFIMGRPAGYAVTARSSNGLEPSLINLWMYKKLAVFFVPKLLTEKVKGMTATPFDNKLKILYMRIILDDKDYPEPVVLIGIMKEFRRKGKSWPTKFEHLMASMEYNESKIFTNDLEIHFEDINVSFTGKLFCVPLFDINTSQAIVGKLIQPALKLYRQV